MAGQEVRGMLIRLEATTAQLRQEMAKADSTVAQVSGRIDAQLSRVDSAFDRAGASAQAAAGVLKGALAGVVSVAGISELLKHAEAYTTIANRLKLVTTGAAEFTAAQNAVFDIAQRSGQPLTATAELYQRIATNQKELKLTGQGVAGIVETISKTMVISGASTESANAALIQLGQAFASGTLRGEELNSVLEQAPALAQAIAKGMGVSVGALRSLGAAGKLTADSVVKALQAQAAAVNELYGKMQSTVSQGMTKLDNSATNLIGKLDQTSGVSQKLSGVLTSVSQSLDAVSKDGTSLSSTAENVTSAVEKLAVIIGARLTLSLGQTVVAFLASAGAAVKQAAALTQSTVAADRAVRADAASAAQTLLTAQSRQVDAKSLLERANVELATAEQKVAADRVRQASEVANLQAVQAALVAERGLEEQRLRAQITETGRAQSIARIAELRQSEIAIINQVRAAETTLAETSVATSAQIQAAYQRRSAAAGAYGETTLAVNEAVAASEKTAAAASGVSRGIAGLSAAGGGLLALLTGPVGMIATVALVAASFIDFDGSTDKASKALIDHGLTVDQTTEKYKQLSAEQQRYQLDTWSKEQKAALGDAATDLDNYSVRVMTSLNQINKGSTEYQQQFLQMVAEVKAGTRSLDSVTAWAKENVKLLPMQVERLTELSAAYSGNTKQAAEAGEKIRAAGAMAAVAAVSTERLAAAQQNSGQTSANQVAWDKYIEQLTKTRDLLGANAAAEAAYTAAKMGATPAQAAQAKIIADQTDTLKKYQDAIKQGAEDEKVRLKAQLFALYTAEDAANEAAAAQKKALDDTARAAEDSARRQVDAMQTVIDQTLRVVKNQNILLVQPKPQNLSGYSLLTNGGTAPAAPTKPKPTPDQRAEAAVAQLDATTDANKRVDKAANAAATALKNQQKALEDLLAKSGIATKASNDIADAYLAGANNVRELTIKQEIETEVLKTGAKAYDQVATAVNAMHDAKDRAEVMKHVADMRVEIDSLQQEAVATLQGQAAIDAFNVAKTVQAELIGKKIAVGSAEYNQLVAATKAQLDNNKAVEQANAANGIVDRLYPQTKLLKDYTQEQKALNAAIALYPENAALYQDALVKLGKEYEVNQSKATVWGQLTEGAVDRIDGVFADAWSNIGSGADNLWDNLVKGAKQAFGEIAHMLTTKPLLASISNWLTGTDNGQGLSSVWGKLLGTATGQTANSAGGLGGSLVSMGKTIYQAYSAITGVGADIAAGYASGGLSGALSGGVNYYGSMLSNLGSTLSSGFSSLIGSITGQTAATQLAANAASAAAAQAAGAAAGNSLAVNAGAYAASAGTGAAAGSGMYAQLAAMASNPVGWVIAAVTAAYQSGKLYDKGVRPDASEMLDSYSGSGAIGKAFGVPQTLGSKYFELVDGAVGKLVGGKLAAMLSGSTLFQAVWSGIGTKLFGGSWQTKDGGISLGVNDGDFNALQYIDQKKKGGLFSSNKKRTKYSDLDPELEAGLGDAYNSKIIQSLSLYSQLGVQLSDSVLDGFNVAASKISTQGKTNEQIQQALDAWFTTLADSAVAAINTSTKAGLDGYTFDGLVTFINNLNGVNAAFDQLNLKMLGVSVAGGKMAESLLIAVGGMEEFTANNTKYYEAFFTDTEKANDTLAAVAKQFTAMGYSLPGTREGFRALVESLDTTTESGAAAALMLIKYSDSAAAAYSILEQHAAAAQAASANYYDLFTTDAEKSADKLLGVRAEFKALGVELPATSQAFMEMVYAAQQGKVAGKATAEALLGLATDASAAYKILQAAVMQGANDSFSALQRSINAQKTSINDMLATVNTRVSDLTEVSNSLSSALKALRGTSDDTVRTLRNQAQATLQSALAIARAGGSLAGFEGLTDALDTVSNNNTDLYSSLEDFNRDQGRTANVVAELNNLNGKQLTSAQQTVKTLQDQLTALDKQLDYAQSQLDMLNGVDNSVKSVADAVNAMNAAVVAALLMLPKGAAQANTPEDNKNAVNTIYGQLLGRDADAGGLAFWSAALQNGSMSYDQVYAAIKQSAADNHQLLPGHATGGYISGPGTGTSDSILSRLSNGEYVLKAAAVRAFGTDALDQMNSLQIPAFAAGGPVLDVSAPSQVFARPAASMSGADGDGGRLEQKVDLLIDVVKQIVGPMKVDSSKVRKLLEHWDGDGLPKTTTASATA